MKTTDPVVSPVVMAVTNTLSVMMKFIVIPTQCNLSYNVGLRVCSLVMISVLLDLVRYYMFTTV